MNKTEFGNVFMESKTSKNVIIELKNIVKKFDDSPAVEDLNLKIYENEFLTLLGPSGCGKTTTLRMIAGFITPDSGEIIIEGKIFNDIPPYARPINTVFQKYALFPHLNVLDNVCFGLKNRSYNYLVNFYKEENIKNAIIEDKMKKGLKDVNSIKISRFEMKKKINEFIKQDAIHAIDLVKLDGFENRKIDQMSGGQQQRIALARAIINKPKILLLDEPLAALDLKLRENMQYELKAMQRKLGITFIFVTHDQQEAMTMSDRIVVMSKGLIQQLGTPKNIYNEPKNRFVANFIGESNIIRGKYIKKDLVEFMGVEFECENYVFEDGEVVDVVVRPEDWDVVPLDKAKLTGIVTTCVFRGVHYEICADVNGMEFVIHTYVEVKVGQTIGLSVDACEISLMKVENNE